MENLEFAPALIAAGIGEIITENKAVFFESVNQLLKSPTLVEIWQTPHGKQSIVGALLKASIFGFRLSPELGECHIVPRNINSGLKDAAGKTIFHKVACFQIGYKGWMKLATASGHVQAFDCNEVRKNDLFDYEHGTSAYLKHKPAKSDRGGYTHFYASAVLQSGLVVFDVIDMEEAELYRRYSDTQYSGYGNQKQFLQEATGIWGKNYATMALRLPIRNICTKKIPLTPLMESGINADGGVTYQNGKEQLTVSPVEIMEIEAEVQELHEDYINEINATKTKTALRTLHNSRFNNLPESVKGKYTQLCTAHALTLAE